jgi:hypothetical protein
MFTLNRRPTRKSRGVPGATTQPGVELLEQRDCPAVATSPLHLTNFAGRILSPSSVVLTGNITDSYQNPVTLSISGGGSATMRVPLDVNNNGQFSVTLTNVVSLGNFYAQALDTQNNTSPQVQTVPGNGPTLTLACNQMANRQVRVYGTVSDVNPANETVNFSGVISGSTTTDANGNYVFVATASTLGNITATATNASNITSNTAQTTLSNVAPIIENFTATFNGGTSWTFSGQVLDEWAMGLTVTVTSPGLQTPVTTTVGLDDMFSVTVNLAGQPYGTATAQTTDWWGATSNLAQTLVRSGNL